MVSLERPFGLFVRCDLDIYSNILQIFNFLLVVRITLGPLILRKGTMLNLPEEAKPD